MQKSRFIFGGLERFFAFYLEEKVMIKKTCKTCEYKNNKPYIPPCGACRGNKSLYGHHSFWLQRVKRVDKKKITEAKENIVSAAKQWKKYCPFHTGLDVIDSIEYLRSMRTMIEKLEQLEAEGKP